MLVETQEQAGTSTSETGSGSQNNLQTHEVDSIPATAAPNSDDEGDDGGCKKSLTFLVVLKPQIQVVDATPVYRRLIPSQKNRKQMTNGSVSRRAKVATGALSVVHLMCLPLDVLIEVGNILPTDYYFF